MCVGGGEETFVVCTARFHSNIIISFPIRPHTTHTRHTRHTWPPPCLCALAPLPLDVPHTLRLS